ncbi:MAG: hypothetical protein M1819_001468 [Sarea resinae]|nr:MAG: hypothetical protein M1819_001468 [Sarea resinae]
MDGATNIVFFHPDLGIGGAERLVIDAAVGLQERGHKVTIFTSHCDPKHCFDEARDGTLDVRVRGNSVVPSTIGARFSILCAILRQVHLVLQIVLSGELATLKPDVFFIDQLSACIPLLRVFQKDTRILFYGHFPDQLLAQRENWLKHVYRVPFDWLEFWSTSMSDTIVVNSEFTKGVFAEVFPSLAGRKLKVVYPCVDTDEDGEKKGTGTNVEIQNGAEGGLWEGKKFVLSINRYERKKNIGLAIRAFAGLSNKGRGGARLVIAGMALPSEHCICHFTDIFEGGYDNRVVENVLYHHDLVELAGSLGLKSATMKNAVTALSVPDDIDVLFLLSIPAAMKTMFLRAARLLVYTPSREHFGIVPLEAMIAGVPVLAANTGGPLETVVENETGWLRSPEKLDQWTEVMELVLQKLSKEELDRIGKAGKERVEMEFSKRKMAERLDQNIQDMLKGPRQPALRATDVGIFVVGLGVLGALAALGCSLVPALAWQLWKS